LANITFGLKRFRVKALKSIPEMRTAVAVAMGVTSSDMRFAADN
jgi:hypothetical protein